MDAGKYVSTIPTTEPLHENVSHVMEFPGQGMPGKLLLAAAFLRLGRRWKL